MLETKEYAPHNDAALVLRQIELPLLAALDQFLESAARSVLNCQNNVVCEFFSVHEADYVLVGLKFKQTADFVAHTFDC